MYEITQLLQTENAGLSILGLLGKGSLPVRTSPLFSAACCYGHNILISMVPF